MPARFGQEPNHEFTVAEPRDDGIFKDGINLTNQCANCDAAITYSINQGLWYHDETYSVRCDVDVESLRIVVDDYAEP